MIRMVLGVSYDGRPWLGWQTQPNGQTVQDQLETALRQFVGVKVPTVCAGRTDTGVHATAQIVHIDVMVDRPSSAWVRGLNSLLPDSIAVQWACPVQDQFHARFSAITRSYTYVLLNTPVRQPLWAGRAGWCFRSLDLERMQQGAQMLVGEHDFSSFRSSQCQAATPVRTMHSISLQRKGELVLIHLKANAFLHHMVRNIVGELVLLGQGKTDLDHFEQVFKARDRTKAAPTYSASGLYLTDVEYPTDLLTKPLTTVASIAGL
ncbi:MAG: tRNA pseudouridine(38-40) synthase TruA [Burkholderiaceae bacterium]|nr:tRNA pseudouridine(38-40) synthase TruA [Burkholderiaceae bacterium]MCD8516345.1 tRNA pseudouridine(38-40) synthase TruA [Burkholderiaceae bacterium]MCD8538254.1 tRNA pseudouridine(38-40) synthase TruA [Burkholderiaceae bacterium]